MLAFSSGTPQPRSIAFYLLPNLLNFVGFSFVVLPSKPLLMYLRNGPGHERSGWGFNPSVHALISEYSRDVRSPLPRRTGRT